MNNEDKFINLFAEVYKKSMEKKPYMTLGEVIDTSPIRIKYGENIILESRHLHIAFSLINGYTGEYGDDNGVSVVNKEVTVKNELVVGDRVMMIPDGTFKKWFVIDKVAVI